MRLFKRTYLLTAIFIFGSSTYSQMLLHSFTEPFSAGTSDPLGNFYLVNGDELMKTDSLGNRLYSYSNPGLGSIAWIDASDPFRILLYYQSFNQLMFLDRTLSPLGQAVKLDELDLYSPLGICRSSKGGFWIIDETNSALLYLNNKLEINANLRLDGVLENTRGKWLPMLEWKERLYIVNPNKTIYQFDLFGTQLKNIHAGASSLSFMGNSLVLSGKQGIFYYDNQKGMLSGPFKPDLPEWEQLIVSKNIALINSASGWYLYRLKKTY